VDNTTIDNNSEVHLIAKHRFTVIIRLTGGFEPLDSRRVDNFEKVILRGNRLQLAVLVDAGRSWPIDDINELPGVLSQVPLQLALFIKDQLRRGIEGPCALALVLVVDF
jgi:hypothetical protein